jgi:hypothetical protein
LAERQLLCRPSADREIKVMTKTLHPRSSEDEASEQIAVLLQLCAEMSAASLALADNDLGAFQEHTLRLDGLSSNLRRQRIVSSGREAGSHKTPIRPDDRIQTLRNRLSEASYRLSALLRRRLRTVSLLARHHQTVVSASGAGDEVPPNLHTWSSEA